MAQVATATVVRTGGCHCGAVRFAVSAELLGTNICRCTSCCRAAGALRVAWTTAPTAAFAWTRGTPRVRASSPGVERAHCADCGTTLTWRRLDRADEIDITTIAFDDAASLPPPSREIWGEDDPPWAAVLDSGLPLFARTLRHEVLLPAAPALELRQVSFATHADALLAVRFAVFVEEQGVPRDIEADDRDTHCLHVLATAGATPVATGRLDVASGKIGRVAVLADWRGRGAGAAVMRQLHRLARGEALTEVWCHAQRSAVPFYQGLGYRVEGDEFEEAGIPHRSMRARLAELAP
jgi:predicted GNAT family N-acyltransferase